MHSCIQSHIGIWMHTLHCAALRYTPLHSSPLFYMTVHYATLYTSRAHTHTHFADEWRHIHITSHHIAPHHGTADPHMHHHKRSHCIHKSMCTFIHSNTFAYICKKLPVHAVGIMYTQLNAYTLHIFIRTLMQCYIHTLVHTFMHIHRCRQTFVFACECETIDRPSKVAGRFCWSFSQPNFFLATCPVWPRCIRTSTKLRGVAARNVDVLSAVEKTDLF